MNRNFKIRTLRGQNIPKSDQDRTQLRKMGPEKYRTSLTPSKSCPPGIDTHLQVRGINSRHLWHNRTGFLEFLAFFQFPFFRFHDLVVVRPLVLSFS